MPVTDSFIDALIHTCTIQSQTVTGVDGGGQKTGSFANVATDVACRIEPLVTDSDTRSREVYSGQQLFLADFIIYFLPDQTVDEKDRIIGTTSPFTDTYEIIKIGDATDGVDVHHREAYLKVAK